MFKGIGPGSVPDWESLITLGRGNYPGVTRAHSPGGMLLSPMNCDLARAVSSCTRVSRLYRPDDQSPDGEFSVTDLDHGVVPIP
jgi:hypothetical protein